MCPEIILYLNINTVANCCFLSMKIPILEKRGLINFKLRSQSNGIGLCPICHYKYDDHRDPKVTFYPTDIEFFIRFELRDRARREKDGSSQRITPTAAQYVRQSGLYNRIQLDWQGSDEAKVLEPAAWNGAPLAALHRTFGMLSCARANGIPKKDRDDLRLLWDLYYGDDDEEVASKAVAIYRNGDGDENFRIGPEFDEFDNSPEGGEGTGTGEEDATLGGVSDLEAVDEETEYEEDEEGMPPRKKRALAGTWERAAFDFRQWQWKSGPQSPSNDKADASLPLLGPTSFHH